MGVLSQDIDASAKGGRCLTASRYATPLCGGQKS